MRSLNALDQRSVSDLGPEIDTEGIDVEVEDFITGFGTLGHSFGAHWHFRRLPFKMRTSVLVTKTDHCLNEILWRAKLGEMPVEITSAIGNRYHVHDRTILDGNRAIVFPD